MAFDHHELELILENIAEDPTTAMVTWQTLETDAKFASNWEMAFRKRIFEHYFPAPKSGINNMPLPANYVLKGTPTVNVKIDETLFPVVKAELAAINVDMNTFIKWKPSLGTGYTELTKTEAVSGPSQEGKILRQMITTTPGAPKLEIVLPAKFSK